ncbi:MAG TPA: N-acetylmuramoyl-L-alanine amidase [bacterium]|nr:N-acetylmuramoyl-L-alanine amidase [bacterium]
MGAQFLFRMSPRPGVLILFFLLTAGWVPAQAQIRLEGLADHPEASVPSIERENILYMDVVSFFRLLGHTYFSSPENQKTVIRVGTRVVAVTPLNPFVAVGDSVFQMAFPTIRESEKVYAPVAHFLDLIQGILPDRIHFDPKARRLQVIRSPFNVTGIVIEEKDNGTLIRIFTTESFKLQDVSHFIRQEWLNVTLLGARVDSARIASMPVSAIIKQIVPFQYRNSVQLSFLLDRKVLDTKVYVQPNEIMISLRSSKSILSGAQDALDESKKRWRIDRIIIDPGHGGRDPGAVGSAGLYEKEVNLDIALRLRRLIERNLGVGVLMTRDSDDQFVPLEERTRFANANDGKLFISIHANSNRQKSVRGVSAYILGMHRTEQALAVAEKENSVIQLEESQAAYKEMQDAAHILNAIAQSAYLQESEELARLVTQNISNMAKIPNQGVHQAGLYVLMGAAMPRILVETAYLSNAWEEKLLRRRDFRQTVAEAIYESVRVFKEKREAETG